MAYYVKHRQKGGYLAKSPYHGIDARYVYGDQRKEFAEKFARYVDAFNACRACDCVVEI